MISINRFERERGLTRLVRWDMLLRKLNSGPETVEKCLLNMLARDGAVQLK